MTYQDYEDDRAKFMQLERELKIARRHNLAACIAYPEGEVALIRANLKAFVDAIQV